MGLESSVLSWLLIRGLEIRSKKIERKGHFSKWQKKKNIEGPQGISCGTNLI